MLDNVAILDPIMRPRVSSSPSNGNETEQAPCAFNGNTQDPYYGDVHQYLYDKVTQCVLFFFFNHLLCI